MTEEESATMKRYGITHETNPTFHFSGYRYQRLEDAVSYAKKHQPLLTATDAKHENNS